MDVVLDRLARALLGGLEQRPDVDVEAEVGERGRHHLGAAVVAVLAELGDHHARAAAFCVGERGDLGLQLVPALGAVVGGCIHAGHLLRVGAVAPADLLQRIADLADRRARAHGVDRELEQVALAGCRRSAVSASSAACTARAVAARPHACSRRDLRCRAPRGCRCRASRSASSVSSRYLLTPTMTSLPASMRACFSAALASMLSLAQPRLDRLGHAAHRIDFLDDRPRLVGHLAAVSFSIM